jgi:hypothetical protein
MKRSFIALYYTESHQDRDRTFLGIFSKTELAKKKMQQHMTVEKARLPCASIDTWNYSFDEAVVDDMNCC